MRKRRQESWGRIQQESSFNATMRNMYYHPGIGELGGMGLFQWTFDSSGRNLPDKNLSTEEYLSQGRKMHPNSRLAKYLDWCDKNNMPYEHWYSQMLYMIKVDRAEQKYFTVNARNRGYAVHSFEPEELDKFNRKEAAAIWTHAFERGASGNEGNYADEIYEKYHGRPTSTTIQDENMVPMYKQGDERWANLRPNGGDIMRRIGCYASSFAMLMSAYTGEDWNPAKLVGSENGSWQGIVDERLRMQQRTPYSKEEARQILNETVRQGKPIVAVHGVHGVTDTIHKNPGSEHHVVVYAGYDDEGNVIVHDPASGVRHISEDELFELVSRGYVKFEIPTVNPTRPLTNKSSEVPSLNYDEPSSSGINQEAWSAAKYVTEEAKKRYGYDLKPEWIYDQWESETFHDGKAFNSPIAKNANNSYYKVYNNLKEYAEDYLTQYLQYKSELKDVKSADDFFNTVNNLSNDPAVYSSHSSSNNYETASNTSHINQHYAAGNITLLKSISEKLSAINQSIWQCTDVVTAMLEKIINKASPSIAQTDVPTSDDSNLTVNSQNISTVKSLINEAAKIMESASAHIDSSVVNQILAGSYQTNYGENTSNVTYQVNMNGNIVVEGAGKNASEIGRSVADKFLNNVNERMKYLAQSKTLIPISF